MGEGGSIHQPFISFLIFLPVPRPGEVEVREVVREPRDEPRPELGVHVGEPGEELADAPGEGASEVKPGDL